MDDLHWQLVLAAGFIEEHEDKKPCRNCGTPLTDYRYFKLTTGGRIFLAAASAIETGTAKTAGLGPKDESAVGAAETPKTPPSSPNQEQEQ